MSKDRFSPTDRPLHCFETELIPKSAVVLHEHDSHELFYCVEGKGFQHTENGMYEMEAGEFYFFPAGQLHIGSRAEDEFCRVAVVNLHAKSFLAEVGRDEVIHRVLDYLSDRAWEGQARVNLLAETARAVGELFLRMIRETRQRAPGYATAVRLFMAEALLTILRDPNVLATQRAHFRPTPARERLSGVFHFIEMNYMNPIDVNQMARLACVSRSHFHAVFKRETGQTLVEYVTGVRVRSAMNLLQQTRQPIVAVAQNCGFASLSHFYHCFKNLTGHTPKDYARNGYHEK
ncbi:MAG: AraC family transcriptional regulator [Phycisphaerae bacterium]|nr:AraC family transcriptional regulator [Phycisphaerae bacterium]